MSELSVPLESIMPCLQGVIPSWVTTCSVEGVPNASIVSIVHYVDSGRVALTRQFINKTRINLDANPQAQVIVVSPATGDQYALDLRYLRTESEGPIFDAVEANLDAIASMTGMTGVFRLRGVDIHGVLAASRSATVPWSRGTVGLSATCSRCLTSSSAGCRSAATTPKVYASDSRPLMTCSGSATRCS